MTVRSTAAVPGGTALRRRSFLVGAATAVGAIGLGGGLTACGGSDPGTAQQAITHINQSIAAAPIVVAEQLGLFTARKLTLSTIEPAGGSQTVNAVVQTTGIGMASSIATVTAYAKGVRDIRVVGGIYGQSAIMILTRPDSTITADTLRGTRIGAGTPDSVSAYIARLLVTRAGLTPGTDVQILNIGDQPAVWTALDHGLVDVACITPIFSTQQVLAGKAKVIERASALTTLPDAVLVASTDTIESRESLVQNWVGAVGEACSVIRDDVDRAADAYANGIGIPRDLAVAALTESQAAFSVTVDPTWMPSVLEAARGFSQLDPSSSVDGLVDARFAGGA